MLIDAVYRKMGKETKDDPTIFWFEKLEGEL